MSDRLYFSCWLRGFDRNGSMLPFQKALNVFRFRKLAKRGPVRRAFMRWSRAEPPLIEQEFPLGSKSGTLVEAAAELAHGDCCIEIDTFWDLWQYNDGDWEAGSGVGAAAVPGSRVWETTRGIICGSSSGRTGGFCPSKAWSSRCEWADQICGVCCIW